MYFYSFIIYCMLVLGIAHGHSWIDCLDTNYERITKGYKSYMAPGNGIPECGGFPMGYPGRLPNVPIDLYPNKFEYVNDNSNTDPCYNQRNMTITEWFHVLHSKPGDTVHYAYKPNGHIFRDYFSTDTTQAIYWTGEPDTALTFMSELTDDRMVKDSIRPFDDGECAEDNYSGRTQAEYHAISMRSHIGMPCFSNFTIPVSTKPGMYNFIWKWNLHSQYATEQGYAGTIWTTCFQVLVSSKNYTDNDYNSYMNSMNVSNSYENANIIPEQTSVDYKLLCDIDGTCNVKSASSGYPTYEFNNKLFPTENSDASIFSQTYVTSYIMISLLAINILN